MIDTPKPLTFDLLRLLADGEFHSGEMLAQQLAISRASVHYALRDVDRFGIELYRVRGRGYRLARTLQWLDAGLVADNLGDLRRHFSIEVIDSAPSSNTLLLQRATEAAASGSVLALEWQSEGRGRLGRPWHSGLGAALTFSVLWRFDCGLSGLSGLSLATGVAVMRALNRIGVEHAGLKWPNDVLGEQGKLAGILVEAQGDMLGPSAVVIGIGINLSLPQSVSQQIDQPVTALADMLPSLPDRNYLLALLLRELHGVLKDFPVTGFAALRTEWERYHALQNHPVHLQLPDGGSITGIARGVSKDGALELETGQGLRRINSGEINSRGEI